MLATVMGMHQMPFMTPIYRCEPTSHCFASEVEENS